MDKRVVFFLCTYQVNGLFVSAVVSGRFVSSFLDMQHEFGPLRATAYSLSYTH